jgi:hypothetical protein
LDRSIARTISLISSIQALPFGCDGTVDLVQLESRYSFLFLTVAQIAASGAGRCFRSGDYCSHTGAHLDDTRGD